jgi:hypothetical protein
MENNTLKYLSGKTETDLLVILETFRLVSSDAGLFDSLAELLDVSDDSLASLRDDVQNFMDYVIDTSVSS